MAKKAAPKAAAPKAKAAAPATKAAAPKKKGEAAKSKKPLTKAELFSVLAEKSGVTKKQVSSLFDHLQELIKADLSEKGGAGLFVLPGLLKIKIAHKAATKEKKGINPFTKEPMTFKAKPARSVVKAIPLKALREMV